MRALAVAGATIATAVLITACGGSGGLIPSASRATVTPGRPGCYWTSTS